MSTDHAVQLVTMNNDGSVHTATWMVSERHIEVMRAAYKWLLGAPTTEALADADCIAQIREVTDGFIMMKGDIP